MRKIEINTSKRSLSTAMVAVALQDHMSRHLCLDEPIANGTNPFLKPPKCQRKNQTLLVQKTDGEIGKEYVLDCKPPALTLAQRLGLVDAPRQLLSESEWKNIKVKACERKDFMQPCVICKEDLGAQTHVLLSCSHVFHKNCLHSYEKHSGKKCCPMCRVANYQTRVIRDGCSYFHHKCATVIQSIWRGYVVRCWYQKFRQTVLPKDPLLHRKFLEEKLRKISDRMAKSMDNDVNRFLSRIDDELVSSRKIFSQFDELTKSVTDAKWMEIMSLAFKRNDFDCPICLVKMDVKPTTEDISCSKKIGQIVSVTKASSSCKKTRRSSKQNLKVSVETVSSAMNSTLEKQCEKFNRTHSNIDRVSHESMFVIENDSPSRDIACSCTFTKPVLLLSCSHLFHLTCLNALEEFSFEEARFVCPVCRSYYQKKLLQ